MADGSTTGWRWSNVPVPRSHVAGLLLGLALHLAAPWRVGWNGRYATVGGLGLVGAGLVAVGWAVRTVGGGDDESPDELVTTGPYAWSRNPMYVAWTALYAGVALLANSLWPWLLLPAVLVGTHRAVLREERSHAARFGDEYRSYRRRVRRYV